jgi:hypothetical protein
MDGKEGKNISKSHRLLGLGLVNCVGRARYQNSSIKNSFMDYPT